MGLKDKLLKNSTIKSTTMLEKSEVFKPKEMAPTKVYALNIAYSGSLHGGLDPSVITWGGPSRHFKSLYTLISVKAWLDKYPDAMCLFYDSEFGTPSDYFKSVGIDTDRVVHTPIKDIEELTFDIMNQIKDVDKSDKLIIAIDSIGNLASKREVENALDEKSALDMTRAKTLKALFRMVTPHTKLKDIPIILVNHTYQTQEIYSKAVLSGGTGILYSSNAAFILGRSQEKDGSDLVGYTFTINVEKSRYVKEKSKIGITVKHEGGIDIYSGLLEIGLETGHILKPQNGWYQRVIDGVVEEKKWRAKDTSNKNFWNVLIYDDPTFDEAIGKLYKVANGTLFETDVDEMSDDEILDAIDE